MIQRVIRYKDNQGLGVLLINSCVLAYIVYITLRFENPLIKYGFLCLFAFLFFIPLSFSTFLSKHPHGTTQLMKISQYLLYAYLIVTITNVFVIPPLGFIGLIFFVVFSLGVAFWFSSHPNILTQRGYLAVQGREENDEEGDEEMYLLREIEAHNRALDEESSH